MSLPSSSSSSSKPSLSVPVEPMIEEIQDDDPCWGSPTHCDLPHLLSQITKEEAIRYESPNYVVLQKPPDLRMDGPYRATVHKLLTYWYPPPSLRTIDDNDNDNDNGNTLLLLDRVSRLHRHNDLADNELRPCHQLDYATSGVLCVARNRKAANFAIQQWDDRKVQKTYLAILEGTLRIPNNETDGDFQQKQQQQQWPTLTKQDMETKIRQLEDSYRARKRRLQKNTTKATSTTFTGYQPPHALFHKYKSIVAAQIMKKKKQEHDNDKNANNDNDNKSTSNSKKKRKRSLLTDLEWEQVWKPIKDAIPNDDDDDDDTDKHQQIVMSLNWKAMQPKMYKDAFVQAAEVHNGLLRDQQAQSAAEHLAASSLPTIFCVEEDPSSVYVYCPLAQRRDEFAMKIPSDVVKEYPHMASLATGDENDNDDEEWDFKPSLTKCTLLETAEYDSPVDPNSCPIPVTKVKLWPITGRRHQLRVHTALLGHAILGDNTYSSISSSNNNDDESEKDTTQPRIYPRMCLHAYSLQLKLLASSSTNDDDDNNNDVASNKVQLITTDDPFVVEEGKLCLKVL